LVVEKSKHTGILDATVRELDIPPSDDWRRIEREIFRCTQIPFSCMVHRKDIWIETAKVVSSHERTFGGEAGG
jgi:hypothetical protein